MRCITHIILILLLFSNLLRAQVSGIPPKGPISSGIGGISSSLSNSWSIFNNPAGLVSTEGIIGVFSYQTIFDFSPFNTVMAAVNCDLPWGSASMGVYRFGDELFSNQMASLGLARKIGIMSLGAKANLLQYHIDGFGTRSVFVAEIGLLAEFTQRVHFGVHIYNFTQSIIAIQSQEKVPTLFRLSINYHLAEQVHLFLEAEKNVENKPNLRFGLSYEVLENLKLRTGFSTQTNRHAFGAGFNVKRFTVDYAIQSSRPFGSTHNFGLTFQIKK